MGTGHKLQQIGRRDKNRIGQFRVRVSLAQANERCTFAATTQLILFERSGTITDVTPQEMKYYTLTLSTEQRQIRIRVREKRVAEVEVENVVLPDSLPCKAANRSGLLQRISSAAQTQRAVSGKAVLVRDVFYRS